MIRKTLDAVLRALRSPKFFYAIVGLLVLQAAWIALNARYPQAFDENYHLGLIQLHTQQWLPFFTQQPPGEAIYGALARDPSYLYHYLLSLPYQVVVHITDSLAAQVIVLRFLNIGIFVAGLFVFRKLLAELGASRALGNTVLLFFVLTPVVPLLAGQINYDNLMFYLTGLLFLLLVRYLVIVQAAPAKLGDRQGFPVSLLLQIVLVGSLGCLVKFPFAPIFLAALVVVAFMTWRFLRAYSLDRARDWRRLIVWPSRLRLIIFGGLVLIALGLCAERYGVNLVQYHAPVPKCDKVLNVDACLAYSPWARDHMYAATYPRPTTQGIAVYPPVWLHRMVFETMFTITSYARLDGKVIYYAAPPLTVANYTAWAIVCGGAALAAYHWRKLLQDKVLLALLAIIGFYSVVLFVQNMAMYLHSGEAVAIHGRYWVPVYPVMYLALALGFVYTLNRLTARHGLGAATLARLKAGVLVIVLLFFLQGGGISVWIVHSQPGWYWQQSQAAAQMNWWAKNVLDKLILH